MAKFGPRVSKARLLPRPQVQQHRRERGQHGAARGHGVRRQDEPPCGGKEGSHPSPKQLRRRFRESENDFEKEGERKGETSSEKSRRVDQGQQDVQQSVKVHRGPRQRPGGRGIRRRRSGRLFRPGIGLWPFSGSQPEAKAATP